MNKRKLFSPHSESKLAHAAHSTLHHHKKIAHTNAPFGAEPRMDLSEPVPASGFVDLGVSPRLCSLLLRGDIHSPTPIQSLAIPVALNGEDLIGIAQTGTGKTLAFGVPMAERLRDGQVGLVLAPTRELAQQIAETFEKLHTRCALVIGGASMRNQVRDLRSRPKVIVATPGRLLDHMNQRTVWLDRVSIAVLDEADRMLDMGFAPAIKAILDALTPDRQTLLFSATMPKQIAELAQQYLREPKQVQADQAGTAPDLVTQELIFLKYEEKGPMLAEILYANARTVLVFARTRHGARKLAHSIRRDGHTAAEIHADRSLAQRREALSGFKTGKYRILVATDIAARGIDVKDISLVVNYDLPDNAEDYLHRIGRTGRAGASGRAISLALSDQAQLVRDIEKLLGEKLPISPQSTIEPVSARPSAKPGSGSRSGRQRRRRRTSGDRRSMPRQENSGSRALSPPVGSIHAYVPPRKGGRKRAGLA